MLAMIHGVQQLVLVDMIPYDEIDQAKEGHELRVWQDTIDYTDNEDEESLWQVEAITENRGLYKFSVI